MIERWVEKQMARGLQGLIALRLPGAPAEDSVTLTLDVWLAAIESSAANWQEATHAALIQQAFRTLYRTCDRWPAPRHFIEQMGNRGPPPALPRPAISESERRRNLARLEAMMEQLSNKTTINKRNTAWKPKPTTGKTAMDD